ncbi:MAG: hypothetical protein Q8N53_03100 [Longimicrobiales bacterium]|nr:hypothetical protein [Longimicrobiales bacterium]
MTPVTWQPEVCPTCDRVLEGLGRWCPKCEAYTEDMGATTDATPEARARTEVPDTRTEAERKADARQAVEMLGWRILDFEQGYRPDKCPACKARLPGGHSTRVPVGIGDWLCQGHGIAAWLEWKTDTNDQTDGQREFGDDCDADGIPYAVVHTTAEAVYFLNGLLPGRHT